MIINTDDRQASGMYLAAGDNSSIKSSRKTDCIMPAIGEDARALKLVAVRAMAPVAGTPMKKTQAMLAMPSPTNSALEL